MFIPDLHPASADGRVVHVGWLDWRHRFQRGPVPEQVVPRLEELVCSRPWSSGRGGYHTCNVGLCLPLAMIVHDGIPLHRVRCASGRVKLGSDNYLVPGQERSYHVPGLILHYVRWHHYRPPSEFIESLLACNPLSAEFAAQVSAAQVRQRPLGTETNPSARHSGLQRLIRSARWTVPKNPPRRLPPAVTSA